MAMRNSEIIHVGHDLAASLTQQIQEGASNDVCRGNVGIEGGVEIIPASAGSQHRALTSWNMKGRNEAPFESKAYIV